MSDLVGNPEDQFSHNEARIVSLISTVKFPNFRHQKTLLLSIKNSNKEAKPYGNLSKDANGIANSEDPDQTAPVGAV